MPIETITVGSRADWLELRLRDVTASAAAALFGIHPYITALSLYQLKTGASREDPEESGPMQRGRLLEPVAVQLLRERFPDWKFAANSGQGQKYVRDSELRIGCTPDVFARKPDGTKVIVQIKSVQELIFRDKWRGGDRRGEIEAPLWIAVQANVEAHLTGAAEVYVAPMVVSHGIDIELLQIPKHAGAWSELKQRVSTFWKQVESGTPPTADFDADAELIRAINADATPGKTIDLSSNNRIGEIIAKRAEYSAIESQAREAEKLRKALDTEIIAMVGDAEVALLPGGGTMTVKRTDVGKRIVEAYSFRQVRFPKGTK